MTYKIGDSLKIQASLNRVGVPWYTDDIYYVKGFIPENTYFTDVFGEVVMAKVDLIRTSTIDGRELIAHWSKFDLDIQSGREEKISSILDT